MTGMADELYSELVRTLVSVGRSADAAPYLEALRTVARGRPNSEAFLWWAEGVAELDVAKLGAAAERFRSLGRSVDQGRVLLDAAEIAPDHTGQVEIARELFAGCGASVYLREADRRFPQLAGR
jgi:hypothetical protein